jgi:hypothetical protein
MQREIHANESLVSEPTSSEVEIATGKMKSYISPGNGQIPAELITTTNYIKVT